MYRRNLAVLLLCGIVLFPSIAPAQTSISASTTQQQIEFYREQIRIYTDRIRTLLGVQIASSSPAEIPNNSNRWQRRICLRLNRALSVGMQGDDVADIQDFLAEQGLLSSPSTGYFGRLTTDAIIRFQTNNGLPGVGILGPQTRQLIFARWCGSTVPPVPATTTPPVATTTPIICPQIYQPVCGRPAGCENTCTNNTPCLMSCRLMSVRTYPNRCMLDAAGATFISDGQCAPVIDVSTATGTVPVINSFSGPTTLTVGQTGTWSISATDPLNGTLSYSIDWGDKLTYLQQLQDIAGINDVLTYTQATTFQHVFQRTGFFTIRMTVTSSSGQSVTTSTTVVVIPAQVDSPNVSTSTPGVIACTQEAKLCPDGSYVSRTGPNCTFPACPTVNNTSDTTGGSPGSTSVTCTYGGKNYSAGYARKDGMECVAGCWNSAKMFVCTANGWVKKTCGFSNLIGPFYNGTQYCGASVSASVTSNNDD